uniref:hypothetical protein n=1 Tax=Acinetobacter baumannii TaxID=470 RepID=UPI001C0901C9
TSTRLFDDAGECLDLSSKFQLQAVGQQVVEFARMKIGSRTDAYAQPHATMAGPDEPTRLSLSRG